MHDFWIIFGALSVPVGVFLMCFALLLQLYVMLNDTVELNQYKDKQLAKVVTVLFFTFSLAVYYYCPKSRKKGIVFITSLVLGIFLYVFSTQYIFKYILPPS